MLKFKSGCYTQVDHPCHALAARPDPKPNQGRNRLILSRQRVRRRAPPRAQVDGDLRRCPPPRWFLIVGSSVDARD